MANTINNEMRIGADIDNVCRELDEGGANYLDSAGTGSPTHPQQGPCSYDHIIEMMQGLDIHDDGIAMNHKIKSIESDFCNIVRDENMLCESMEYINEKALIDGETALKFALLFSSRNFDALAMKETKVRSAMLKILETNFLNADIYRLQDKNRLYNSITLLGEYYHRVRLADNSPITILGKSLLSLLTRELSELVVIDVKLAKIILSQITLNGHAMRTIHKDELTQLLFHIRRNLIEQPSLKPTVKAMLLMTLDLYYSNFKNLGLDLEQMYTKYLIQEDGTDGEENKANNNVYHQKEAEFQHQQNSESTNFISPDQPRGVHSLPSENLDDNYGIQPSTKKWSEQVCEDSLGENEIGNDYSFSGVEQLNVSEGGSNSYNERTHNHDYNSKNDNVDKSKSTQNSKRAHKLRKSPRQLEQNNTPANHGQTQQCQLPLSVEEKLEHSKPLPRWRAPRFNRDTSDQQNLRYGNQFCRFNNSFDDDRHSVRSEGGGIRLYSVNDRLKHSQEKIDRNSANAYNSIANSNWDRQSQHDDRSERSYISNYERGNYKRGHNGQRYAYNNNTNYDKPPRFQRNQQRTQHMQHQQRQSQNIYDTIHSDSWRRSGSDLNYNENNYPSHSSRSDSTRFNSPRARTLPRPAKSSNLKCKTSSSPSYRRSQSPSQISRNCQVQYSSQSSLASEESHTYPRRGHSNSRNRSRVNRFHRKHQEWEDSHSMHGQLEKDTWEAAKDNNNTELVRNARQTTKYMNYLSSKNEV